MATKKKQRSKDYYIERRNGVRADRVLAVKHRLVKPLRKDVESEWSLSTTRNMSVSGLLFLSFVPYKVGDVVQLEIVMSGMIEIYKGYAEVVRVQEIPSQSFDVAVKYVELKFRTRPAKSHLKK